MFSNWKKNKVLKSFVQRLPSDLSQRYGKKDFYTLGQLSRTLEECKYSSLYHGYAQVIFLSQDEAMEVIKEQHIYNKIRRDLAQKFFGGDMEFNAVPLTKRSVGNPASSSIDSLSLGVGGGD